MIPPLRPAVPDPPGSQRGRRRCGDGETVAVYVIPAGASLPDSALGPLPEEWRCLGTATEDGLVDGDEGPGGPLAFWLTFHRNPPPGSPVAAVIEWVDRDGWTMRAVLPRLRVGPRRDGRRYRCTATPDGSGITARWYSAISYMGGAAASMD